MRKILCVILLCASMLADKRVEIYIEKIHCPLCTAIVRKALAVHSFDSSGTVL